MKPTGFHHIPTIVQPVRWILGCFLSLGDKVKASHQIGFILTLNGGSLTTWTILLPLQICCRRRRRRRRHSSYTFDLTGRYCSSIALLPLAQSSGFHVATGYLPRSANQMTERAPPHHYTINSLPWGEELCWQSEVNVAVTTSSSLCLSILSSLS